MPGQPRDVQYVIRGTQLPAAPTIQQIVKELDRRVPPSDIRSLRSLVDDATARVRLTMLLIAIAGVAALSLGVIGVYTVVPYAASGRARELGIRLALGAAPARVGGIVLGDGLELVAIGTFVGLVAALGATRLLRALLYAPRAGRHGRIPLWCSAASSLRCRSGFCTRSAIGDRGSPALRMELPASVFGTAFPSLDREHTSQRRFDAATHCNPAHSCR